MRNKKITISAPAQLVVEARLLASRMNIKLDDFCSGAIEREIERVLFTLSRQTEEDQKKEMYGRLYVSPSALKGPC